MKEIKISIIVPVFNEEKTLNTILEKINQQKISGIKFEIIVVNDGSTDDSLKILKNNSNLYQKLINLEKNMGKGGAVREGLLASSGDYILFQDADMEYDPSEYSKLLKKSGLKHKQMSSPKTLELGKILCDTSYYGWLINFAQITKIISDREKVDYDEMWSFADEIHKFLGNRPKMFPGFIGGHCVIPNLSLIDEKSLQQIDRINNSFAKKVMKQKSINKKHNKPKK